MADKMSTVRRAAGKARRVMNEKRAGTRTRVAVLERRVRELDEEVQECRRLNLRLAELTDIVQELLVPVAQRDHEKVTELVERYRSGI
jgi:hypothetical protein